MPLQPNHTRIVIPNLPHAAHIKLFERTTRRRLGRTLGTSSAAAATTTTTTSSSPFALGAVRAPGGSVVGAAAAAARLGLDLVLEPVSSLFPAPAPAPARRRARFSRPASPLIRRKLSSRNRRRTTTTTAGRT